MATHSKARAMLSGPWTRLPMAVAAASARAALGARTQAASARPKLRECPTLAEEVHTPKRTEAGVEVEPHPVAQGGLAGKQGHGGGLGNGQKDVAAVFHDDLGA